MSRVRRTCTGAVAACVWLLAGGGTAAQPASAPQRTADALHARARSSGTVRVIVRLQISTTTEAALGGTALIAAQRSAIAGAQQRVMDRLTVRARPSLKRFATIPFLALDASAQDLDQLAASPEVATIVEDVPAFPTLSQSTAIVGAAAMFARNYRGDGWNVAILDTGVDAAHPFLAPRVISEACYSTTGGSFQSLCPDGGSSSTLRGSAAPCAGFSGCQHGTHVAGIAAGAGSWFNGVAPEAGIIAIQIFSSTSDPAYCATPCVLSFTSDQMLGLERVYALRSTYRIAAVNMSLGGGGATSNCDTDPRKPIIDQLRAAGIATVVAAGNSGYINALSAPACISSAVSVGATADGSAGSGPVDSVPWFSNSASFLTLLAPGQYITSSVPGGGFATLAGTSMAAPHVAGAFAVLRGRNPSAGVDSLLSALVASGTPVTDARNGLTTPRIDLEAARSFVAPGCTLDVSPAEVTVSYAGQSGTLTVTAPDGCAWRLTNDAPDALSIASPAAGVGRATVAYTVAANPGTALRTATVRITEGEIQVSRVITQPGMPTIAGDVSGDARPDLIWQQQSTNALGLWVMNGTALRDTPSFSPNVADPGRELVATADIDGDGHVDLIFQHVAAGVIEAWLMNGTVRRSVQQIGPALDDVAWHVVGAGDFNADGRPDLVMRHEISGALGVWFLAGTSRVGASLMSTPQVDPQWKVRGIGDFNRDNKPDLAWQHAGGALAVWFMDGVKVQDTRFLTIPAVGDPAWRVAAVADVNGDLRSDLVWQHETGWIAVWYLWDNIVLDTSFLSPARVTDATWKIVGPR